MDDETLKNGLNNAIGSLSNPPNNPSYFLLRESALFAHTVANIGVGGRVKRTTGTGSARQLTVGDFIRMECRADYKRCLTPIRVELRVTNIHFPQEGEFSCLSYWEAEILEIRRD